MASALRSKASALASAATKAATPAIEQAQKQYAKLIADNAQYVVKDKEAADKLTKQLVFTKLASIPDTAAACSSEWKIVKQTWYRRQDLPLSEAGLYAAFVGELFAWFCVGEVVGRGGSLSGYSV